MRLSTMCLDVRGHRSSGSLSAHRLCQLGFRQSFSGRAADFRRPALPRRVLGHGNIGIFIQCQSLVGRETWGTTTPQAPSRSERPGGPPILRHRPPRHQLANIGSRGKYPPVSGKPRDTPSVGTRTGPRAIGSRGKSARVRLRLDRVLSALRLAVYHP